MKRDLWNQIFEKYAILEHIKNDGKYEITSKTINEFREARLMTKFDNASQLPLIFSEHKLSILPITRGSYVIAPMDTFCQFPTLEHSTEITYINFPETIQSLSPETITSEALALNAAYLSGIFKDFIDDENLFPTVSGKMSSQTFNFKIMNLLTKNEMHLAVDKALIEIDAGYESVENLLILEAKNHVSDDFIIRQLYYPFRRLLESGIHKNIRTVFMVYTNNTFHLYEYIFSDPSRYNSLQLKNFKRYRFEKLSITSGDIEKILKNTVVEKEPSIPFPQADSFERVINLCELLYKTPLTKTDITKEYGFDKRQTDYYVNAGKYLGLIKEIEGKTLALSDLSLKIMSATPTRKQLKFAEIILKHSVFNEVLKQQIKTGTILSKNEIIAIMKQQNLFKVTSEETYGRRASTIRSWIDWITSLTVL